MLPPFLAPVAFSQIQLCLLTCLFSLTCLYNST